VIAAAGPARPVTASTCTPFLVTSHRWEPPMSRYAAPLGFTLCAIWVAVVFFLASV
jgi:hypothetical protein